MCTQVIISELILKVTHFVSSHVTLIIGGKGLLADEEQRLFKLRQEKEEQVQREISKQRQMFEREAKDGQLDKLCATPFGVDVVGITEFIALTGALVGGKPHPQLSSCQNLSDSSHALFEPQAVRSIKAR